MECEKVQRLLSSYLDNSLKFTYTDSIKEHIAKCQKCMDELDTMTKIDNLLKLKVKEKPSEEYWENYWQKLESRLDRTATPRLSGYRRLFNRFIPKFAPFRDKTPQISDGRLKANLSLTGFAFALNGILIALLIFLGGLLHIRTQEMEWLQSVHEKTIEQISAYLLYPATRGSVKTNAQFLDKYDMLTCNNYHSKSWLEISFDVASEEFKNGVKNIKKEG
ncbi:zf-HC2 domain-containing protein [bacterium]|nr:zf-HC2 domain-containing protein [bacterium]